MAHSSSDQRYEIIAEVRDQSRRTIVGNGSVLATRKPFTVFSWVDRGCFASDTINASFHAKTLDNQPVQDQKLRLLRSSTTATMNLLKKLFKPPISIRISKDWQVSKSRQRKRAKPHLYEVDTNGHIIEGGYIFTIIGNGFDGGDFRFSDLELIPDKAEYRPAIR